MTNWDYALMAHEASLLGGPELYISSIREAGYIDGIGKGAAIGTAVTAALSGLAFLAYIKIRERKALAALAEAAITEALLESNADSSNDNVGAGEENEDSSDS